MPPSGRYNAREVRNSKQYMSTSKAQTGKKTICYVATSAGDWGGASRYLFVTLKKLDRSQFEPLVLFPAPGPILPELEQLGIAYEIWPEHEPHSLLNYASHVLKFMRFLRGRHVDLLHVNHVGYWRPAEILAARLMKVPVITHLHRVVTKAPPYLKYSTAIVANSRFTAESSAIGKLPVHVTYCPVELERYDRAHEIRAEFGVGPQQTVISFLGQIRTIKGIDLFIEMAKRIRDAEARFWIVGACRDPARFKGAYTEEELHNAIADDQRISYLGYRGDVENIYRSSDIIVMPSQWDEPFGLINIEAGASRKPMIATRSGGIPEIIRHGENGYLVPPGDVNGLYEAVHKLLLEPTLRTRMGMTGRKVVIEHFSERQVVKETLDLYKSMLTEQWPKAETI